MEVDKSDHDFVGVWWLLSREDRANDGTLMKRDRTDLPDPEQASVGRNNNRRRADNANTHLGESRIAESKRLFVAESSRPSVRLLRGHY
jgi:hypothetical protein